MPNEKYFGFLSVNHTAAKDGYLGAILVLDSLGRPLEFRATYPVKPSVVQRTLYGDTLEPYVGVELCGKPLLKAIDHELELLVVNSEALLAIRPTSGCAAIFLQKAGEVIEVTSPDGAGKQAERTRIDSLTGRFQPVVILTSRGFEGDLDSVKPRLEELFSNFDLTEPFDRINQALGVLASQDKKFQ
jgi:hypothetical protein